MNTNYEDLLKNINELNRSLGVYQGVGAFNDFTKTLNAVYARNTIIDNLCKSELSLAQEISNSTSFYKNIEASKVFSGIQNINKLYSTGLSSILEQHANLESFKGITEFSKLFKEYNLEKISSAYQSVLGQVDWTKDMSVEEIADDVAEQYIVECLEDKKQNDDIVSMSESKEERKKRIREDILYYATITGTIFGIIGVIIAFISLAVSKQQVVNNTIEVNNYYTTEICMDAELLNELGYRIITENNVMPRVKPDRSSIVTGHLHIGQVVSVSDKWKKWIEINWTDSEGNYCTGWIQNYKVTEFK